MATRSKTKSRTKIKSRRGSFRGLVSIISLSLAIATGYVAGRENSNIGGSLPQDKVFESFAELGLDLDSFTRMRNSPLPPLEKPRQQRWTMIAQVLDGDTLRLSDGTTVRLIGIDAPESSDNKKLKKDLDAMTVAARPRDLVRLGEEATRFARAVAEGRHCWLEYEREKTDLYGRVLAYVHLDDGTILNEAMLSNGYAKAYLNVSFRYKKRYVLLHNGARLKGKGLWRKEK